MTKLLRSGDCELAGRRKKEEREGGCNSLMVDEDEAWLLPGGEKGKNLGFEISCDVEATGIGRRSCGGGRKGK